MTTDILNTADEADNEKIIDIKPSHFSILDLMSKGGQFSIKDLTRELDGSSVIPVWVREVEELGLICIFSNKKNPHIGRSTKLHHITPLGVRAFKKAVEMGMQSGLSRGCIEGVLDDPMDEIEDGCPKTRSHIRLLLENNTECFKLKSGSFDILELVNDGNVFSSNDLQLIKTGQVSSRLREMRELGLIELVSGEKKYSRGRPVKFYKITLFGINIYKKALKIKERGLKYGKAYFIF